MEHGLHETYLLFVAPTEAPHRTVHIGADTLGYFVGVVEVLHAPQTGEEFQELIPGHPIFEGELTGQVSYQRADADAVLYDVHPEDLCPSISGGHEAEQCTDGSRFAGTVWPEESEDFSFVYGQVYVLDAAVFTVGLCEPAGFDYCCSCCLLSSPLPRQRSVRVGYCFHAQ